MGLQVGYLERHAGFCEISTVAGLLEVGWLKHIFPTIHKCMYVCVGMYVCMYVCLYVCV